MKTATAVETAAMIANAKNYNRWWSTAPVRDKTVRTVVARMTI